MFSKLNLPFKKRNLTLLVLFALTQIFTVKNSEAQTIVIPPNTYDPTTHDGRVGVTTVDNGASVILQTPNVSASFKPGNGPAAAQQETLRDLLNQGHATDPSNYIDKEIVALGPNTTPLAVPDPITGGAISIQTYDSSKFVSQGTVGDKTVNVYDGVGNEQYINMAIAEIQSTGGSLTVEFGDGSSDHTSAANKLNLAAKQSILFDVNGQGGATSQIDWTSNNRINFFGAYIQPPGVSNYTVNNIATFAGRFNVKTLDGKNHLQNVSNVSELKEYNDWLIQELKNGNLDPYSYEELFNRAITTESYTMSYEHLITYAGNENDEIFQPFGNRIIINAYGVDAQVNIESKLEGQNASSVVQLSDSAKLNVESTGVLGNVNGSTVNASGSSSIVNDGVINANFITKADGSIEDLIGSNAYNGNVKGIVLSEDTSFINNNILNVSSNPSSGTGSGIYLSGNGTATNSATGTINVGVNTTNSSGLTMGVHLVSANATFTNDGEIYIGREHQNTTGQVVNDVLLNQQGLAGIGVMGAGNAINNSTITLGSLTQNAAALYASGDGNDITLINNGTITLKDNSSLASTPNTNYGIFVYNTSNGSNIANNGEITLNGVNARAIQALSTSSATAAHVETTANSVINVHGAATADKIRNYAVWVEGQDSGIATATIDGQINLLGEGAIGVHARGNATITVKQDAIPNFINDTDQIGFFAYGNGARIIIDGTSALQVNTQRSTLFRLENGADFTDADFVNLNIDIIGDEAQGILGTGNGTVVNLNDTVINVSGNDAVAVIIEGAAKGTLSSGVVISLDGQGSIGAIADGNKHNLKSEVTSNSSANILTSDAQISTGTANDAIGYIVQNNGNLTHTGNLNFTNGTGNTGIFINNSGKMSNTGTVYVANGTGVRVSGAGAQAANIGTIDVDDGIAGVHILNGANLNISGSSSQINVNGSAHGILVDTAAGSLRVADSQINVNPSGTGNGIENASSTNSIVLQNVEINVENGSGIRTGVAIDPNSTAMINVTGSGAGFSYASDTAATAVAAGDFRLGQGYTINVSGAGATGIRALSDGGTVVTEATVNVSNAGGGSALVAGTAAQTLNLGHLSSVSTTAPVVDLSNSTAGTIFENQGVISAADVTAIAVQGSAQADQIYLSAGTIRGDVHSGDGDDYILFSAGAILDGSITTGSGASTVDVDAADLSLTRHITAVSGGSGQSIVHLRGVNHYGGSFAADDLGLGVNLGTGWNNITLDQGTQFTLTDNLTVDTVSQAASVVVGSGSTLYAGNAVNPVIGGTTSANLTVENYGTIDLTNGGSGYNDVLTIQGDYSAASITRLIGATGGVLNLETLLNQGGLPANQHTDRLLVEGNASGVTTVNINIVPTPEADQGAATDLNGDGRIGPNEGISIVQVAGDSTPGAFVLPNGYVAVGAFAYELYAFAPGESAALQRSVGGNTAGDQFWDYRLANGIVASTRWRLVPQASTYLSLATGLGQYDAMIVDDLHKRLGELRYQTDMKDPDALDDIQIFIRGIASDYDYRTDKAFANYGYDFSLRSQALQVGVNFLNVTTSAEDNINLGVAWTHGSSTIKPDTLEGYAEAKTDSDMVGLYATWQKENGFYVDGILAGTWHKTDINTFVMSGINSIDSDGWVASIESGYPYRFDNGFILEPQVQLVYSEVSFDDTVDRQLVVVKFDDNHQFIGRLGLRGTKTWVGDDGTKFMPYARINYYHDFSSAPEVRMSAFGSGSSGVTISGGKGGDALQFGLGITIDTPNNFILYSEVDYQTELGDAGLRGIRGNLGIRWEF